MPQLHFSIAINAPVQKVWTMMLGKDTYPKRTIIFNPAGSWFEGDWVQGSQMRFLGPDPKDPQNIGGILSEVAENNLFKYISLKHVAEIRDGVAQESSREDAFENYTFSEKDGVTIVEVALKMPDAMGDCDDYMKDTWPKALELLKELSEVPWKSITVSASVYAPVAIVWEKRTMPKHIMQWNNASPDRHTPYAENDLREGGRFLSRMAAKDGSVSFDFTGTYVRVEPMSLITSILDDGRKMSVVFHEDGSCGTTTVTETFEMENMNSEELQRGWRQAILDNFKKYVETT
jgi:uncharacterized protein YndB with AHSA1/START domain